MIFVYGSYFHMKYDGHVLYCMYLYCILYASFQAYNISKGSQCFKWTLTWLTGDTCGRLWVKNSKLIWKIPMVWCVELLTFYVLLLQQVSVFYLFQGQNYISTFCSCQWQSVKVFNQLWNALIAKVYIWNFCWILRPIGCHGFFHLIFLLFFLLLFHSIFVSFSVKILVSPAKVCIYRLNAEIFWNRCLVFRI